MIGSILKQSGWFRIQNFKSSKFSFNKMENFKHDFNSNQHNNDLLKSSSMLMAEMAADHLHHLQAVAQLLIDNLCPLGHRQVAAGGQEQVLLVLPVPVEVWGVQKIT